MRREHLLVRGTEMAFNFKTNLDRAPTEKNLAEHLSNESLGEIGQELLEIAEQDRESRKDWMDQNKESLRLATQVREDKSYPWPGAANIKYPLLTTAAMQFHARALPNLIPDDRPIKTKINGKRKPDQSKQARADRVGEYMSYQVLVEQDEWLDETDRMLFILPMVGICFKKTYFSGKYKRNKSELLLPNELYINYYAKTFEGATKTHRIPIDKNVLIGLQRQGFYLNTELACPSEPLDDPNDRETIDQSSPDPDAHDTPYVLYEMECWLDLDDDGYREPYFATIDSRDGTVLRIVARWKDGDILYNESGEIIEIKDYSQITPYIFLPDPVSATSGMGLGTLLGPTNEAVNTLLNQLVDAGTLSNMQGGFMAKGVNLRGGATRFRPGEWKIVNATGDDLRKSIVPMPVKEPSNVLFQLLGFLLNAGQILGSITDIMVGQNPGQNQKATTSMIVQEQGMAVYSSIYKRIYRALGKEYKKFYELNYEFLDKQKYNIFFDMDEEIDPKVDFFDGDLDIVPSADPSVTTDSQRIAKAMAPVEMLQFGTVNPQVLTRRILEAQGQTDIDELMNVPTPPPSIDERKQSLEEQVTPIKLQLEALATKTAAVLNQAKTDLTVAQKNKTIADTQVVLRDQQLAEVQAQADDLYKRIELLQNMQQGESNGEGKKSVS